MSEAGAAKCVIGQIKLGGKFAANMVPQGSRPPLFEGRSSRLFANAHWRSVWHLGWQVGIVRRNEIMSYSDLDFYSNVIERFNALPEIY